MMAKKLAIPQILRISKLSWRTAQINRYAFADTLIHYGRPPSTGCIFKSCESMFFKSVDPVLDSARTMAEKLSNLSTTKSRADKQDRKSVV